MLITGPSPHILDRISVKRIMRYVVLALMPAALGAVYFFGLRALWIILVCVAASLATEAAIQKAMKKTIKITDGSAVITGLLMALSLPPTVPLWMPAAGAIIGIGIGKHAFGGLGHNVFNPALVGRAFLVASWPALMTTWVYPARVGSPEWYSIVDATTSATPLAGGGASYVKLITGNISGCLGETSAILLLAGAIMLLALRIIDWRIPAGFIGTVLVGTMVLGQDPVFHVLAGGLLIGAFFMATDYVTSPITKKGRLIFGIGCGLLVVVIRIFSGLPEGVTYAILLMNGLTPLIERFTKPRRFGK
ncbi:MAG: RnfABCDGE type electron transport complex subunit D [archaeon]